MTTGRMKKKQWYEALFVDCAKKQDTEVFLLKLNESHQQFATQTCLTQV